METIWSKFIREYNYRLPQTSLSITLHAFYFYILAINNDEVDESYKAECDRLMGIK